MMAQTLVIGDSNNHILHVTQKHCCERPGWGKVSGFTDWPPSLRRLSGPLSNCSVSDESQTAMK